METNYLSVAHITFHALPHLVASRGHLAVVSSISGLVGVTGQTLYSAAKHAVHGLMDSLRIELDGTGVTVTTIAPDVVATNVLAAAVTPKGARFGQRFVPSAYMSSEECAKIIVRGLARRKRLVLTTARSRFALFARLVVLGLVDWMGARASATLKLEPHAAD
jgi:short-subunit dehydrogenase